MTTTKKTILIVFLILCIAFTAVASVLALPHNNVQASAAEETRTTYNYQINIRKLPFPMNEIYNYRAYEGTLTGNASDGIQYKLFEIEIYELQEGTLYFLDRQSLKVTVMYDTGHVWYPLKADGTITEWRDDIAFQEYTDNLGNRYGVMTDRIDSNQNYIDKNYNIYITTYHEIGNVVIRVIDTFTGHGIYTNNIPSEHNHIMAIKGSTNPTEANKIVLNGIDQGLTYLEGYEIGKREGELIGEEKGFAAGEQKGRQDGYEMAKQEGYGKDYNAGFEEGYKKGSYDVDILMSETTGTAIGSFTDMIMKFLSFEVAGISMWAILATIGAVLVTGIIIKLVI